MFIHDRPSGSNDTTDIYNQTTCIRMLHKIVSLLENTVNTVNTVSCVAHRRPVPPGQPDHMPTRGPVCSRLGSAPTGIQCILLVPAYAQRTTFRSQSADKAVNRYNSLARSRSHYQLGQDVGPSISHINTDARTRRITQYRRHSSKSWLRVPSV